MRVGFCLIMLLDACEPPTEFRLAHVEQIHTIEAVTDKGNNDVPCRFVTYCVKKPQSL